MTVFVLLWLILITRCVNEGAGVILIVGLEASVLGELSFEYGRSGRKLSNAGTRSVIAICGERSVTAAG